MYKIEKFRSEKNSEYYFRVVAENGKIVCSSEGYKNKVDRDEVADSLPFVMNAILMNDVRGMYGFKDIDSTEFVAFTPDLFEEKMNELNWFRFPMYKIYLINDGKETYYLNKNKKNSPYFNFAEKENMVEWSKLHTPKISRIEEINIETFNKNGGKV